MKTRTKRKLPSGRQGNRRVNTDLPKPGTFNEHQLWSTEDFRILHEYYPTKGPEWVARKLGRTPDAVKIKASRTGIRNDWLRAWTKKERAYLVRNHLKKSVEEIAEALDRSVPSVSGEIQGLRQKGRSDPDFPYRLPEKTSTEWTEEELEMLREKYGAVPLRELAEMFNRSRAAVSYRARKIGLVWIEEYRKKSMKPRPESRGQMTVEDVLTDEQKKFILENMKSLGCAEIARRLGIPHSRALIFAKRNGYGKEEMPTRWSKKDLDYLRKHHGSMLMKDIARKVGRKPATVVAMAKSLGLSGGAYIRTRHWSEKDIALLRRLYPKKMLSEIAKEMGRTEKSVRSKAKKLKLHETEVSKYKRDALWTAEQDKRLRKLYGTMTYEEMAPLIGRDKDSLSRRAIKLGLAPKKGSPKIEPRLWTEKEDRLMRQHYRRKTVKEIAGMLGRSTNSVQKRAQDLNIAGARNTQGAPRKWAPEEDRIVRRHHKRLTPEEIAEKLGRTPGAVTARIKTLKLGPPPKKREHDHRPWLPEEEDLLRKEYGKVRGRDLAGKLGRSVRAIRVRALHLGLAESRPRSSPIQPWTAKEDKLLRKLYGTLTYDEIAERMDRTLLSVQGRVRVLGIQKRRPRS